MNNLNQTRRHFIAAASATAAAAALAAPALAHHSQNWTMPEEFAPTRVNLATDLPAGEIHVDPGTFRLYWTEEDNKAIRFVVGIGRKGLYESGVFTVGAKKEWPSWRPTNAMIERNPGAYAKYAGGMPGGPNNPLGARALYLFNDNGWDTMLRIHGTTQPWTINSAVSNGCVRLENSHAIALYDLVPIGTRVVLH